MSNEAKNAWQSIVENCTQVKADGYFTATTPNGELVLLFYNMEAQLCMTCAVNAEHLNEFLEKKL